MNPETLKRLKASGAMALGVTVSACGGSASQDSSPIAGPQPSIASMQGILSQKSPSMDQVLSKDIAAAVTEQVRLSKRLDSSAPASDAGMHDLIWYNESTGETVSWTMDGLTIKRTNYLLRNGDWRLTHSADLNGDGQDDFIWEDVQHGRMAVWIMNGPGFQNVLESKLMLELRGWNVTHVADFNGDGNQDLIYRNPSTGQTVIWLMDGTRVLDSTELRKSGSKAEVVGVGDLDGDGQADLIWRNEAGEYEAWMMAGSELRHGPQPLATYSGFPVIPGRDPFVNDKHLDKPAVVAMASYLSSTSILGSAGFAHFSKDPRTQTWIRPDSDYNSRSIPHKFLGAANLDGSAEADILFQSCVPWPCSSAPGYSSETLVGGKDWFQPLSTEDTVRVLNADPNRQLSQILDLNGDGKEDLVWRDRISGQVTATLMNGINTIDSRLLLSLPAWNVTGIRRSQDRPLARVSGFASGQLGSRVDLDGRASIAKGPGSLSYEWVLKAPPGSQAQLLTTSDSKTSFVADVAGSYTAELVVRRDGVRSKRAWFPFHATAPTGQLGPMFIEANGRGDISLTTKLTQGLKSGDLVSIEIPELLGLGTEFLNSRYAGVLSKGANDDDPYFWPSVESVQGQTIRLKVPVTMGPGADLKLTIWNRPPSRPVLQPGTYTFSVSTTRHPTPVTARVDVKPSN